MSLYKDFCRGYDYPRCILSKFGYIPVACTPALEDCRFLCWACRHSHCYCWVVILIVLIVKLNVIVAL